MFFNLVNVLIIIFFSFCSLSFAETKIENIIVNGNSLIDTETILDISKLKKGNEINKNTLDNVLKELFQSGLFKDVKIKRTNNNVIIDVIEQPQINQVVFRGNESTDQEKLFEIAEIRTNLLFSEELVNTTTKKIKDFYISRSFYGISIDVQYARLNDNKIDLIFDINEGDIYTIRRINFIGNKIFSDRKLKDIISSKETVWWRFLTDADNFKSKRLEFDVTFLEEFYFERGYTDFKVLDSKAIPLKNSNQFDLVFVLEENFRFRISSVNFSSDIDNLILTELRSLMPINDGEWFNKKRIDKGLTNLVNYLSKAGFPFAQIDQQFTFDRENNSLELFLDINEGSKAFVEKINIVGNVSTLDRVIRREIEIVEGDPYSLIKVNNSLRKIRQLGFFKNAKVITNYGSNQNKAILDFDVEERPTGDLSLGFAYSSLDDVSAEFGISEKNFLGTGQRIAFSVKLSDTSTDLSIGFTRPYLFNRNLTGSFDLSNVTDTNESTRLKISGDELSSSVSFTTANFYKHRFSYTLSDITTETLNSSLNPITNDGGKISSSLGYTISKDTRDNWLNPTSGYLFRVSETLSGLGGDTNYLKSQVSTSYYNKHDYFDLIFGIHGELGLIEGLDENISKSNRFTLGGRKVRGFDASGIGPRQTSLSSSSSIGGNQYYAGRIDIRSGIGMPKDTNIKWTVFSDFGSLWGVDDDTSTYEVTTNKNKMRISLGYGFSWETPIGPLNFTWANAIQKENHDATKTYQFRIGSRF